MPDANKENTLNQLVGAAFGAAGQRCMALSTAVLVGEAKKWLPELVERAKNLRVNAGTDLFGSFRLGTWLVCICVSGTLQCVTVRSWLQGLVHGMLQREFCTKKAKILQILCQ